MADLDAFVTIASSNGDGFNLSSNNDLLIYTDSSQQNILIGNDSYAPHVIYSNGKIEMFKNTSIQGDLDVTGIITQSGGVLGSKWKSFFNTIYTEQSNVSIGLLRSNSLLTLCDPDPISPSNAMVSFTNNVVSDGFGLVGLSNTGDLILWHTSNFAIRFGTSNTEYMTITENGKVGISKNNPVYTFDVQGDVNFTGDLYRNGVLFSGKQWTNNGASMYSLNSNVGIGIDEPQSRLHLHRPNALNVFTTFTNSTTGSNDGFWTGIDSNGNGVIFHTNQFDIRFGVNNTDVMVINKDGVIGINTSTPDVSYNCHIDGSLKANIINVLDSLYTSNIQSTGILHANNVAEFDSNVLFNSTTTHGDDSFFNSNVTMKGPFYMQNDIIVSSNLNVNSNTTLCNCKIYDVCTMYSNLNFTSSTGTVFLSSVGTSLGINTSSPTYTLDVNGYINATGYCNLLINSTSNTSTVMAPTASALNVVNNRLSNVENYAVYASNSVFYTSNLSYNMWSGYNTTSFYTIKSNVGIGTSTPLFNLDVSDSTRAFTFITFGNSSSRGKIGISNTLLTIMNAGVNPIVFGNNDTEYMRLDQNGYLGINKSTGINYQLDVNGSVNASGSFYQNGVLLNSGKWNSNSDGVYVMSNIGINTFSSATNALAVVGNANINGNVTATAFVGSGTSLTGLNAANISTGVTAYKLLVGNSTGNGVITPTALHWDDLAKRFGINTSTPNYDLDVNGTINATNLRGSGANITSISAANISSGISASKLLVANSAGNSVSTPNALHFDSTNNYLGIGTVTPNNTLDVNGNINFTGNLTQNGVPWESGGAFSNNSSNVFVLAPSNVGIGTANPQAQLHVTESLRIDGMMQFSGFQLTPGNVNVNTTGVIASTSNIMGYCNLDWGSSNGTELYISGGTANDQIRFKSAGVERMRLTGAGRLGIGTNNPASALDVNGTISTGGTVRLTSGGALQNVTLDASAITSTLGVANGGTGQNTLQENKVLVGNGTTGILTPTNLHWDSANSRLGIVTSTPTDELEVNGTTMSKSFTLFSGINNSASRPAVGITVIPGEIHAYGASGGTSLIKAADDGFLRISAGGGTNANQKTFVDLAGYSTNTSLTNTIVMGTAGVERMRITGAGNVGIGTTGPAFPLDVYRSAVGALSGNQVARLYTTDAGISETGIQIGFKSGGGVFKPLIVYFNGVERFSVENAVTNVYGGLRAYGDLGTPNQNGYYYSSGGQQPYSQAALGISITSERGIWVQGFGVAVTSDSRIKKDINPIGNCLEKISQLNPVTFKHIDNKSIHDEVLTGFVAQEVLNVYPNAIRKNSDHIPNIYKLFKVEKNIISNSLKVLNISKDLQGEVRMYDYENKVFNGVLCNGEITLDKDSDIRQIVLDMEDQIFVYGIKVHDLMAVDKDSLFTLGIGAIKELHKENNELKQSIQELQDQILKIKEYLSIL
jgi:hypothetical protein